MMEVFSVGGRFPTTAMRNTLTRIIVKEREGEFYRHIEHSRDPQCDFLSRLAGHHEDKERDHIDEECRQNIIDHVESCSSPYHYIVPEQRGCIIGPHSV